jgi:hypothetical protein
MTVVHTIAGAVVGALLFSSGLAKLAVPAPLGRALGEVFGGRPVGPGGIRAFAAVEVVAGLFVPAAGGAPATRVLAAALGVAFAVAGLLGRVRSATVSCGCFGPTGSRPLGWGNVLAGTVLLAWAAAPGAGGADHRATLLLMLGLTVSAPVLAHRGALRLYLRPVPVPGGPR